MMMPNAQDHGSARGMAPERLGLAGLGAEPTGKVTAGPGGLLTWDLLAGALAPSLPLLRTALSSLSPSVGLPRGCHSKALLQEANTAHV